MFTVETGRMEEAIEIMREVSLWGGKPGGARLAPGLADPRGAAFTPTHRRRASVWAI